MPPNAKRKRNGVQSADLTDEGPRSQYGTPFKGRRIIDAAALERLRPDLRTFHRTTPSNNWTDHLRSVGVRTNVSKFTCFNTLAEDRSVNEKQILLCAIATEKTTSRHFAPFPALLHPNYETAHSQSDECHKRAVVAKAAHEPRRTEPGEDGPNFYEFEDEAMTDTESHPSTISNSPVDAVMPVTLHSHKKTSPRHPALSFRSTKPGEHKKWYRKRFRCDSGDCLGNELGFNTVDDLKRHRKLYHNSRGEPLSTLSRSGSISHQSSTDLSSLLAATVRPQPPYEQFCQHMRPQLEADNYPREQIQLRIDHEWRKLSPENRHLWDERYNEQIADYERYMDAFKSSYPKTFKQLSEISR